LPPEAYAPKRRAGRVGLSATRRAADQRRRGAACIAPAQAAPSLPAAYARRRLGAAWLSRAIAVVRSGRLSERYTCSVGVSYEARHRISPAMRSLAQGKGT